MPDNWEEEFPIIMTESARRLYMERLRQTMNEDEEEVQELPPQTSTYEGKLNEDTECSICLEKFTKNPEQWSQINCRHFFHTMCINNIMNKKCPICRRTFNIFLKVE
jgi:hypothetical protein